jgi:hypothetical protein
VATKNDQSREITRLFTEDTGRRQAKQKENRKLKEDEDCISVGIACCPIILVMYNKNIIKLTKDRKGVISGASEVLVVLASLWTPSCCSC